MRPSIVAADRIKFEDELYRISAGTISRWEFIAHLQDLASNGLDPAADGVMFERRRRLKSHSLHIMAAMNIDELTAAFAADAAEHFKKSARSAVDAACVVFAHTLLDNAVTEYCYLSARIDENDWLKCIQHQSPTFQELEKTPLSELRQRAIRHKISKRSLVDRLEVLQAICKPGKADLLSGYSFDADRIKNFDKLRQRIIHAEAIGEAISDAPDQIKYAFLTHAYALQLVQHRFGIRPIREWEVQLRKSLKTRLKSEMTKLKRTSHKE